jgi:RNA polymerase sigma-70 factor, ECF subfamily
MSETLSATMAQPRRPTLHFDALFRESRGDLYAYVFSVVGDRASAEDVVAIAFERAYRKRRGFNPSRGSARQWLFGIARNAALDELRRRSRSARPVADAGVYVADAAADLAGPVDDRTDAIRVALAGLQARDRELIALKFFGGLSYAEIAATLGITEANARVRMHRALTALREACA